MFAQLSTLLRKCVRVALVILRDADAISEEKSRRSGVFSWAGESHSFAFGASVAFLLRSTEGRHILGVLASGVLFGSRGESALDPGLTGQIRSELPYALGGAFVGYVAAVVSEWAIGVDSVATSDVGGRGERGCRDRGEKGRGRGRGPG